MTKYPDMVPPAPAKLVIEITLGETVRTPREVQDAVDRALGAYGLAGNGTLTPFAQQPGFPEGFVLDKDDAVVGTWKVTGV